MDHPKRPQLSIIVPAYNEAENLPGLLPAVDKVVKKAGLSREYIIVDDSSTDDTHAVATKLATDYPLQVVRKELPRGIGSGIRAGIAAAKGEGSMSAYTTTATSSPSVRDIHAVRMHATSRHCTSSGRGCTGFPAECCSAYRCKTSPTLTAHLTLTLPGISACRRRASASRQKSRSRRGSPAGKCAKSKDSSGSVRKERAASPSGNSALRTSKRFLPQCCTGSRDDGFSARVEHKKPCVNALKKASASKP
jgi:hypothetical protein